MTDIVQNEINEIKQSVNLALVELRAMRNDINRFEQDVRGMRADHIEEMSMLSQDGVRERAKLIKELSEHKKKSKSWVINYRRLQSESRS